VEACLHDPRRRRRRAAAAIAARNRVITLSSLLSVRLRRLVCSLVDAFGIDTPVAAPFGAARFWRSHGRGRTPEIRPRERVSRAQHATSPGAGLRAPLLRTKARSAAES